MLRSAAHAQKQCFSFNDVIERARAAAVSPYTDNAPAPGGALSRLTYDQYRKIRFDSRRAVWADQNSPFRLEVLPAGFLFSAPVRVYLVQDGAVSEVLAGADSFLNDSGVSLPDGRPVPLSGMRVVTRLNTPSGWDEFLVFQGASYFRAVPRNSTYGLSSRGLVIQPEKGAAEEFPAFTAFWVQKPGADDTSLAVYALLESPSVTGAYQFTVTPGDRTTILVKAVIFAREDVAGAGIAPLTSMFYFNGSNAFRTDDFRNGSHDSDGFYAVLGSGETIWRQLINPTAVSYASFTAERPQLFGLLQRARDTQAYGDFEAQYEKRPSAWIVPGTDWPEGSADMIEIPSGNDTNDNIVTFWKLRNTLAKGSSAAFSYTLVLSRDEPQSELAPVSETRSGLPAYGDRSYRIFVVGFLNKNGRLPAVKDIGIDVQNSSGTVSGAHLESDPVTGGVRLSFELHPEQGKTAELRARLTYRGTPVSETWLYRWSSAE